jgi:hypothetical protein
MVQAKPKRLWYPSELERRVGQAARLIAEREAARIPWSRLQEAREKFMAWEAFAFWVRAIEDAEEECPKWLARAVGKRCPGFLEFVAQHKHQYADSLPFFWSHLQEWIQERIFAKMWREGWMNAVGYYAARDLASLRNHAYWDYCERDWKRTKPVIYPPFREWLKASEHCTDRVLDDYGMREEKRRLIKLSRRVGARALRNAVTRYLDGEVFVYWARTAIEVGPPLPVSVEREVNRRCPGFLEADAAAHAAKREEEPHFRFYRLLDWIGEHEFGQAQKQGWDEVLLYQVNLHARHARVIDYWHDWESGRTKERSSRYPSFSQWRRSADSYTFELHKC